MYVLHQRRKPTLSVIKIHIYTYVYLHVYISPFNVQFWLLTGRTTDEHESISNALHTFSYAIFVPLAIFPPPHAWHILIWVYTSMHIREIWLIPVQKIYTNFYSPVWGSVWCLFVRVSCRCVGACRCLLMLMISFYSYVYIHTYICT